MRMLIVASCFSFLAYLPVVLMIQATPYVDQRVLVQPLTLATPADGDPYTPSVHDTWLGYDE
jgi:hypothetical protein